MTTGSGHPRHHDGQHRPEPETGPASPSGVSSAQQPATHHNHHVPGWGQLENVRPPEPLLAAGAQIVVIADDVPRPYFVETWDPPYGTANYTSGIVTARLAKIVATLQWPDRRVRITRPGGHD